MSASHLTVVPEDSELYMLGKGPESRADRVRRLQANAKALAREEIESMQQAMAEVGRMAAEIASGGDAYPVGIREMSSRLIREMDCQVKSIEALLQRS